MTELVGALALGALALLGFWISWRNNLFSLPFGEKWEIPIRLPHVIGAFSLYFFFSFLVSFLFHSVFQVNQNNFLKVSNWFSFIASSCVFASLFIYWKILPERAKMGVAGRAFEKDEFGKDCFFALLALLAAFPLVLFLNQLIELTLTYVFQITQIPDQLAVRYLKATFGHPLYLLLATSAIIVLAPLTEETLFRGFLQSFIRQHLGVKQAVIITSACFSLFHYSSQQGLGNLPIVGSLFILSLFLGFLYERQRSLLAPIILHALFNSISVLNLYFLGGFSGGI
ncbi:MAG: hypothetical protein A3E80_03720 [Chlamydiae bacterium RIFCSPHIGHO2_12_FULL_49_9]|nr:MAG: hypothetical protein A3E80_03720 [Chlamydiae bacterium RIFCSPHIGHO2_12_FULL_49_9]